MADARRGYSAPPQRQRSFIGSFFGSGQAQQTRLPWDLDEERGRAPGRNATQRSVPYSARSGASASTRRTRAPPRVYKQPEEPYDSEEEEERGAAAKRTRVIKNAVTVLVGLYCNGAGTLLAVFVPQTCDDAVCTYRQTMCIGWTLCTPLQQAALLVNFISFGVAGWALLWFWTREKWLVSHLYRDPHASHRKLPRAMVTYPELRMRLDRINGRGVFAAELLVASCVLNAVLSAIMIFWQRYAGGRSLFGYFMQSFLLLPQVVVTWQTASESHRHGFALSLFRTQQVSYNALLPQYTDGRYYVPAELQKEQAAKEELHGRVIDAAAAYLQSHLHVVEKHARRR